MFSVARGSHNSFMSISPPITWFGGKSKLANRIIEHFPVHRTYVEPFGGSAAVLLAKQPSPVEVYNDIDGDLVNLFRVLRNSEQYGQLLEACERTLYSRAEFNAALHATDDPVEAARRFMVRQRQSHGGLGRVWSYCVTDAQGGMSSAVRRWLAGIERLPAIHDRLRKVQIEDADWSDVLRRYDRPETLYYLDPPYATNTRVGGEYRYEMDENDHRRLVSAVMSLCGKVVLSGYYNEDYRPLEENGWQRVDFDVPSYMSPRRNRRQESLWLSPTAQLHGSAVLSREAGADDTNTLVSNQGVNNHRHYINARDTERELVKAIAELRQEGRKITKSEVGRRIGISREHLSRRYKHFF